MLNFPTRVSDCDPRSSALLDLFFSSDFSVCFDMAFSPLRNSNQVVVSVSIGFPANTKPGVLFLCIAYDYYRADWDGLCYHSRDIPCEDILKLSASAAASEFCD